MGREILTMSIRVSKIAVRLSSGSMAVPTESDFDEENPITPRTRRALSLQWTIAQKKSEVSFERLLLVVMGIMVTIMVLFALIVMLGNPLELLEQSSPQRPNVPPGQPIHTIDQEPTPVPSSVDPLAQPKIRIPVRSPSSTAKRLRNSERHVGSAKQRLSNAERRERRNKVIVEQKCTHSPTDSESGNPGSAQ